MASTLSFEALTAELMALSPKDQAKAFSAVLLSAAGKGKGKKAAKAEKAEKDPDAPKKAANNYIKFTNSYVWPVLKAHAETLDEDDKKALRSVSARTQISADLYAPIKALDASEQEAAMEAVTEKSILAAYASWKKSPPAAHCKADKEAKASSVTSGGSKSAKVAAAPVADAEADAKRAAKIAKANATRAANKVAKALEAAAPAVVAEAAPSAAAGGGGAAAPSAVAEEEEVEVDEEAEEELEEEAEEADVELKEWTAPLELRKGKGIETFLSAEVDGKTYLFEKGSRTYIGLYMAKVKKINPKAENPLA